MAPKGVLVAAVSLTLMGCSALRPPGKAGDRPVDPLLSDAALNCTCKARPVDLCSCETYSETMQRIVGKDFEERKHCFAHNDWHRMMQPAIEALSAHGVPPPSREAYEFGLFKGGSLRSLIKVIEPTKIWAFDSFGGMPNTNNETSQPDLEDHYSADPRPLLKQQYGNRVGFVEGFFNTSLTGTLRQERGMLAAQYVGIDCDLSSSPLDPYTAMDWMFAQGLIKPGTMIGYDDWWELPCNAPNETVRAKPPLETGEGLAHVQMAEKYGVRFQCVAGPCLFEETPAACSPHDTWGPIFVVEEVGANTSSHGFTMTPEQVLQWKARSWKCQKR